MRLIDADALIDSISLSDYEAETEALETIATAPTIDVAPVRHGRWIPRRPDAPMFGAHYCSECEAPCKDIKAKYCPNCGAKMDGDDNEID